MGKLLVASLVKLTLKGWMDQAVGNMFRAPANNPLIKTQCLVCNIILGQKKWDAVN